jgi:hypothetical protein
VLRVLPATGTARDECRITAFRIDVTDRVMAAARKALQRNTPVIDRALAGLDLRKRFQEWWDLLQTPIALTDSVWLLINPMQVRKGYAGGQGRTLVATVSLTATPRVVVGPRPVLEKRPLPALDSAAVGEGLHILAEGIVDYGVASDFLTRELRGRHIQVGGGNVRIRSLRLFGIGAGRLALELDFDGTARGRVFFVGTPELDTGTNLVSVPDLEFDVGTADALVRGVNWLAHDEVTRFLRNQAKLPITDAIAQARHYLDEGLNYRIAHDVRLHGEVDTIMPIGVHATRRALLLRAHARAHARLEIREDSALVVTDSAALTPPARGDSVNRSGPAGSPAGADGRGANSARN